MALGNSCPFLSWQWASVRFQTTATPTAIPAPIQNTSLPEHFSLIMTKCNLACKGASDPIIFYIGPYMKNHSVHTGFGEEKKKMKEKNKKQRNSQNF